MRHIQNANAVRQWIQQKQELEVMLAWDLLETFNSSAGLIQPIRNMARQALDEILQLKRSSPIASAAVTKAWQGEMGKVALCKKYPRGFNSIDPNQLDAQDCSDLVRLYGAFIEIAGPLRATGAAGDRGDYELQNVLRESHRVDFHTRTGPGGQRTDAIWNQDQAQPFGRHRDKGQPAPTSAVHDFLKSQKGGMAFITLVDTSTVHRIDQVFGLVPAADISGTTTDNIYFMERFKNNTAAANDPIYHLLPLATIVSGAHHSLIEVALSLSLNGIIDYHIGFYSTLLPRGGREGAAEIRAALTAAEGNPRNRHMLVHYRGRTQVAGCFLFESRDHWAFRDFARSTAVLRHFRTIPAWPNEAQLRAFCLQQRLRLP